MERKKKILIVEDDGLLRELYVNTLTEQGYLVESVVDGEEAYDKIKNNEWDLILLDIILPKINGLDVIKKVKAESLTSTYKTLLFLTNLDKSEEIKEALELGDGYLIKSQITPDDLVNEVKRYIAR